MFEKMISFGCGFVVGALYSSYKYDKNPNELVQFAKDDALEAGKKISDAASNVKDGVVTKFQEIKKSVNGVDVDAIDEAILGADITEQPEAKVVQ